MFFLGSTPKAGTPVLEIPKFIKGKFLTVEFSEQSLKVEIHRVSKYDTHRIEIFTKDATYLDSLSLHSLGLNKIDTAYYDGLKLIVRQDNIERKLNLEDSLKSGLEEISIVLDLSKNLFAIDDTVTSKLLFANGVYYLNIDGDSLNYNSVIAFKNEGSFISFQSSLLLDPSSEEKIDVLSKGYGIWKKRIDKGSFYSVDYYADLTDQEFFDLMATEELFFKQVWYKIDATNTRSYLWILWVSILIILGVALLIKRIKTNAQ